MTRLSDVAAERAVLAGICRYGADAYLDIVSMLQPKTFTLGSNECIFNCVQRIMENDDRSSVDIPSILSAAHDIGISHVFENPDEAKHLKAIFSFPVELNNVRKFAAKIRKLEIARLIREQMDIAKSEVGEITGDEPVAEIMSIAEDRVFRLGSLLHDDSEEPQKLGMGLTEYLAYLAENPVEQMGISTGFHAYDGAIGGGVRDGTVNVIAARPKAQPLYCRIATPDGFKRMSQIQVGDQISDPVTGGTTQVVQLHPMGVRPVFQVTFDDGSFTQCCADHEWRVRHARKKHDEIKTTLELMNTLKTPNGDTERYTWRIPITHPVGMNNKFVKIHPYVMGCLLGDGSFRHNLRLSSADLYIVRKVSSLLNEEGYTLNHVANYDYSVTHGQHGQPNKYIDWLRDYCLWMEDSHNKFIPASYLENHIDVRIQLLQGLMDTDGYVDEKGRVEYTTVSAKLAVHVKQLVQSLGGKATISIHQTKECTSYRLYIAFLDNSICFSLPRKVSRCKPRQKRLERKIVSIEYVEDTECQCITVDSADNLYLTDRYIVTKNCGKTMLSDNIADNITDQSIPVLNMDTEMLLEDHQHRFTAKVSHTAIDLIETGKFANDPEVKRRVMGAAKKIGDKPYYHKSISGMPFEEQLALMRRWITKEVGLNADGTAKPCVIIYDYLKLMDSQGISADLKEYQLLGFMMTTLHNFAVRYKIPIIAFMQLNRDGITKESTDTASGSDRIIWLCSNFSIFKRKSPEEMQADGVRNGNRKLVPVVARHGAEFDPNDYINFHMEGWCATIKEGKTKFEIEAEGDTPNESDGFVAEEEYPDDGVPFE